MKILKNYNLNWRYISLESNFLVFNNWILNNAIINAFLVAAWLHSCRCVWWVCWPAAVRQQQQTCRHSCPQQLRQGPAALSQHYWPLGSPVPASAPPGQKRLPNNGACILARIARIWDQFFSSTNFPTKIEPTKMLNWISKFYNCHILKKTKIFFSNSFGKVWTILFPCSSILPPSLFLFVHIFWVISLKSS